MLFFFKLGKRSTEKNKMIEAAVFVINSLQSSRKVNLTERNYTVKDYKILEVITCSQF